MQQLRKPTTNKLLYYIEIYPLLEFQKRVNFNIRNLFTGYKPSGSDRYDSELLQSLVI